MIDRELQKRWEKKLQHYGLGIDQPMTDNSDGELEQASSMPSVRGEKHPDHARLRTKIDSSDQFLEGGFEVKAIRSLEREIPEWALSNKEVQRVLMTAFPKLSLIEKSRKARKRINKAGRWMRIIHLYYRMGLPKQIVAKELKMREGTLDTTLRNINRVERGLTVRGEVRKETPALPQPMVVRGEKGDETK